MTEPLKPGTPLPWEQYESDPAEVKGGIFFVGAFDDEDDAAFAVEACNAYPTLLARIEALEGALKPFADFAAQLVSDEEPGDHIVRTLMPVEAFRGAARALINRPSH